MSSKKSTKPHPTSGVGYIVCILLYFFFIVQKIFIITCLAINIIHFLFIWCVVYPSRFFQHVCLRPKKGCIFRTIDFFDKDIFRTIIMGASRNTCSSVFSNNCLVIIICKCWTSVFQIHMAILKNFFEECFKRNNGFHSQNYNFSFQ